MRDRLHRQAAGRRGAFTLIELLLSLALVGLLMVAMNQFIFSMGELWGRGTDGRLFDRHVRTVTHFLEKTLDGTVRPAARGMQTLDIQDVQTQEGLTESMLTFELPAGSHVLPWPDGQPLPDVVCSLSWRRDEGLILYWHSMLETDFSTDPPRSMVLSPFVTAVTYDYYDPNFNRWQNCAALQHDTNGKWELPTRLHLYFAYGKLRRETTVTLPMPSQALPLF